MNINMEIIIEMDGVLAWRHLGCRVHFLKGGFREVGMLRLPHNSAGGR